eukprot:4960939-Pyramimonas_sp.AAC.1
MRASRAGQDDYVSSTIPIDFHSDGVEVFNGVEYIVFSWSSALVSGGSSYDMQMPIMIIEKGKYVLGKTDVELISFIKWNLEVLESGYHPKRDHRNVAFPPRSLRARLAQTESVLGNGWFATFHAWTGDLKEKVICHRFEKNWQANFICELCMGAKFDDQVSTAYAFGPGAAWRQHMVTHNQYLLTHVGLDRSPWAEIRSWSIHDNHFDILRLSYLGFVKDDRRLAPCPPAARPLAAKANAWNQRG